MDTPRDEGILDIAEQMAGFTIRKLQAENARLQTELEQTKRRLDKAEELLRCSLFPEFWKIYLMQDTRCWGCANVSICEIRQHHDCLSYKDR